MLDGLRADVAFALRLMSKRPAFSALVVVTLAIGIGANTAIFTLADALLLRPLPYRDAEQLHLLWLASPPEGDRPAEVEIPWSYPKFRTLRNQAQGYSAIAGVSDLDVTLTGDGPPERIPAEIVSSNYFDVLGIGVLRGRTFEAEYAPGSAPYAVISEGMWHTHFGSSADVLGRTLTLNGSTMTVIGVVPAGFRGVTGSAQLWLPLAQADQFVYPGVLEETGNHWLQAIGRARADIAPATLAALTEEAGRAVAEAHAGWGGADWRTRVVPFRDARQDPVVRRSVLVLLGAVCTMLLIACVNVANLLLARATQREREVAVRLALGASRRQLLRQLLTESLVLALAGMAAGLLVALWGVDLLSQLTPERTASFGLVDGGLEIEQLALDWRVLAYAAAVSVATGLLFGAAPAVQLARSQATVLRESAHGKPQRRALRWLGGGRGVLVVTEIALALVLLTGATLMLRSFAKLRALELGFEPRNVLTFSIEASSSGYTAEQARLLQERLVNRIAALPGVEAVGADRCPPLRTCMTSVLTLAGERRWDLDAGERGPAIGVHHATPDYFRALGVPVRQGRVFDGSERPGGPLRVVLNESTARKLFPGQDPIGQRLSVATAYFSGGEEQAEVIGVVGDVRYAPPDQAGDDLQVYAPAFQWSTRVTTFMVKASRQPEALIPALRTAVAVEAPDLPVYDVRSMEQRAADATAKARFATTLLGIFAAAALALAAVGIYGVMSFAVAQRTRELGVRMALGARGSSLLGLVLRQGGALLLLGAGIGLAGSLVTTRALRGLLFEVAPHDPLTFAAGVAVLAAVAMSAVLVPAWRAMRHDPMHALRDAAG